VRVAVGETRGRFRVFLDGVERTHVLEADEEARFIVRHRTDASGRAVLNAAGDGYERERLDGCVVIQPWPEDGTEER